MPKCNTIPSLHEEIEKDPQPIELLLERIETENEVYWQFAFDFGEAA